MNISCGIDIIEIKRIKEDIEKIGNKFLERIFTEMKLNIVNLKKHKNIKVMLGDLLQKKLHLRPYQI